MAKQVMVVLTEEDALLLQALLDERRNRKGTSRPSPGLTVTQSPHGIVAMTPSGGIPAADADMRIVNGALCDMYREERIAGSLTQKLLTPILMPNGSPWQDYVFHLDPEDAVGGSKPVITFPTKWGTRFALWEACSDVAWGSYYT